MALVRGIPFESYVQQRPSVDPCPVLISEGMPGDPDDLLLMTQASAPRAALTRVTQVFELRKSAGKAFPHGITVGRIENNDIVLDERSVSRFHAYFVRAKDGSGWQLVDADSKLGTWLDGKKLAPKTPTPIRPRARIRFGALELLFLDADGVKLYRPKS